MADSAIPVVRRRPVAAAAWLALLLILAFASPLAAQRAGTVQGTVVSALDGAPLADVTIRIPNSPHATRTDASGRFQLVGVPAGRHRVEAQRLGLETADRPVDVGEGLIASVTFRLAESPLLVPAVVVSATRESQRLSETAASVGVISGEELQAARPTHPSAVMSQIPGVWVNVTGGEGHMTAIRQPQTTKPVYLFLEDGVPTRSTGFFNHNALYEVNLPQAGRVEVLKGPATALYGSDAIGGVINTETRRPSMLPTAEAYAEGGAFGYHRLLLSGSNSWGGQGIRADLNLTRTDGWRDATAYDRQSGTLRWDADLGPATTLRTVLTGSRIAQETAGSSALPRDLYAAQPTLNTTPISLRNVRALRLSTAAEFRGERSLVSVTPFARWNEMELLPNWSLTYDPTTSTTGHASLGVLVRARRDFEALRARLIGGVDVDYSPGSRVENRIVATRTGDTFTSYTVGELIYDYDVVFRSVSPYLQVDASPLASLHLTAGLRYDAMGYRYSTKLTPLQTGRWRRPEDANPAYRHFSPKLGAAYDIGSALSVYGNYTHGFRAPSEGQIFRQGSAANTLELKPVTADSYEAGVRGELFGRLGYSLAAYTMRIENDILGYTQPDGTPETQNAGETLHRGVEASLSVAVTPALRGDLSLSRARHTYKQWSPRTEISYAGNEMESAPNTLLNGRLTYTPRFLSGARIGAEWNRVGEYWLNPENSHRYEGHDLFHLSTTLPLPFGLELAGRVMNLGNSRYAESASYTQARGEELAPGLPRTVYLGVQYRWQP